MVSPGMRELAQSIAATGEAIKQFQEDYLSSVRTGKPAEVGEAAGASSTEASAIRHAELIQGIMANMDELKQLAKSASARHALPAQPGSVGEFGVRQAPLLLALNDVPQVQIVTATRAKLTEADSLLCHIDQMEKLIR